MSHLKSKYIKEEKISISGIPAILLTPKEVDGLNPTIIFYHGWSSNKESQRIRGLILATVGYQVLIPDAIHHGERNPLKNYGVENTIEYFWDIILNNLEEGDILVEELISKYKAHPERIGVMGHSMGGITAAGVFTHNPRLKTLVVLNGSCAWGDLNERFKNDFSLDMDTKKLEGLINRVDPINNLDLLVDRSILLQNAASDEVVPPESQEVFYKKIVSLYKEHNRIKLLKYPNLNHFVTTNMIDDSISWLHKYL